jgi:DNA-binding winged helix-turn-helix (wHTH) protein
MTEHGVLEEFEIAGVRVRPRERVISSAGDEQALEPLVMKLLVLLSRRPGQLAQRREILEACWGTAAVGDDSLNRVIAGLRRALRKTGSKGLWVDTVPGAGYVLRIEATRDKHETGERVVQQGIDSWRLGLPRGDWLVIEELRQFCVAHTDHAQAWGLLALSLRHAAEYEPPELATQAVLDCERAARHAVGLEPNQPEALTALVSVVPLFGDWSTARARLLAILAQNPDHPVPTQDLATLEMSTGRIRESKAIRDRLIEQDPLAAISCYKSVYQNWSVGDLACMDHLADRALQLWPFHPAVWTVRFWTYAYTGRLKAAAAMVRHPTGQSFPPNAMRYLTSILTALETDRKFNVDAAVRQSMVHATLGPAAAIQAMFGLGLFEALNEMFEVAEAYYLRSGSSPVPLQHSFSEPALNEQHRRLTQVLFTPVFKEARRDPRFTTLCERIGLQRYWREQEFEPDFMRYD